MKRTTWFDAVRRLSLVGLLPGVLLTAGLALAAVELRQLPALSAFSALILALLGGLVIRNTLGLNQAFKPGVTFALRRVLRLAVALLGLQLSLDQMRGVGVVGLLVVVATLCGTYLFTVWLGRWLGVDRKLCYLIGAGTSICGASAVLAANTVAEGSDEDAAYAVAVVTVFGTLAMLAYPLLAAPLTLSPEAYGLWTGSSIHEVAQVVAAAQQNGKVSGDFGTVTKLSRVLLLAPVMALLGLLLTGRNGARTSARWRLPVPGFVLAFVGFCILNSVVSLPPELKEWVKSANQFLLAMALAAMGLETDARKLARKGFRPLALGACAWVFIAVVSFGLIRAVGY